MKTIIKIFIFTFLPASILMSCKDVVEVDINSADIDLIAVEAYVNTKPENNIFVKLEKSLPVNKAEQNPALNNAIVEISDNEPTPNTITLEEIGQTGIYIIAENESYLALPERTYTLTITTADGVVISAKDYIHPVAKLDTIKVKLSPRGNYEYLAIYISSQETPGKGNYYKWFIYINNRLHTKNDELTFASDELVDGNYIHDYEIFIDWGDYNYLFPGHKVRVEQHSISESTYNFYQGMINQAYSGSPFSVPPANLQNNLSANNGKRVLGFFSASDVSVGNEVIIDESNFTPPDTNINTKN
ncbi:DUF4249 domain-containing protein [Prolixibacteraceae bacterium Z1-6]|uniref:DUF4249 domain-containing protein n=1 Tax=Draconibacterium aestuarii TaxID=2998507 RepID=A0A9X3FHS3_9BACT|nr:DUF4249 domain-containing protein [Prolixibacteraceae bacterium Z1-6]